MAKRQSLMLKIGILLAIIGCILVAKPFNEEPLWAQWMLGFPLFYIGVPLAIVGAAIHFVGNSNDTERPFSPPAPK